MRNKEMCARFDMVNGPVGSLESDLITQVGINGQSNSKKRLPMYSQVNISHVLRHFPLNQHIKKTLYLWWHPLQYLFQQCLLASDHNGFVCDSLPRLLSLQQPLQRVN